MQKLLVFFAGLLLSLSASAAVPVLKWTTGWEVSPISAGQAYVAQYYPYHTVVRSFVLPGTETVLGADRLKAEFWLCPRDKARLNPATEMCEEGVPNVCAALMGQDSTLNWSLGYTRTPNIDADSNWKFVAPPVKPPSNGLVCDPVSSCKVALVLAPTAAWQSLSPTSEGLYRVSVDYDAQHMGESCTPTPEETAGAHPAADKPTCPGFVGEVNGVAGCYGTASNPTANDVPESKPKPPGAGNPPAGKKPNSGDGSGTGGAGRTPSKGDGGPAGGPAGAAGSGTKPDGTQPKPGEGKEQANCGAPGQPKCGIDESGTPTKFDGDKAALDKWKTDMDANRATIKDADGGFFDSYSMFFAVPPIVPCEPIELPNEQVLTRQCDVVEGTRSVMSYIWALAAIWICLGWIREAI
jgi:hypothetical protein